MPNDKDLERRALEPFDENDPNVKIFVLAQRITALTKEKEELEETARKTEQRLSKIEATVLDPETLKWLAKADKDKLSKIDAAIQFMNNAEFMGKWTWRGVTAFIALSTGFYAAFKFWKGG